MTVAPILRTLPAAAMMVVALTGCRPTGAVVAPPSSDVQLASSAVAAPPSGVDISVGSCVVTDGRADTDCTPGALNPAVTQDTVASTICVTGWTKTVRPPSSYTTQLKDQQKVQYGEGTVPDAGLEEDHLAPIELGGAPRDPLNLWPEPRTGPRGAAVKDAEENLLRRRVCAGQEPLADAQAQILRDWTQHA